VQVTNEGLEQGYCVVPSAMRLLFLLTFLKRFQGKKKIMVFFSTCKSTKFHAELFRYIKFDCLEIRGGIDQNKRTPTFLQFIKAETGILLCTNVAARGLDFPHVVCFLNNFNVLIIWIGWSLIKLLSACLGLDCAV